ncbi:hypothetical protein R8789_46790 [Streptomyces malaysiensis]|nr:hypothetical protein R8789_00015 [Streptomyces malaysiensis]WPB96594.1 hypothetical protein R8789_46790 [Streptomyces malaysiensis]
MQGLAMVPLLVGYDVTAPQQEEGRIFGYDVTGGPYEKTDFHAEAAPMPVALGRSRSTRACRQEAALAAAGSPVRRRRR